MSVVHGKLPESRTCKTCEKEIPDRCTACFQFIYGVTNEKACGDCGQHLSAKAERGKYDFEGKAFIKQKDGAERPICNTCERPCQECPECCRGFESGEDASDDEDSDDDDDTDEEEENEEEDEEGEADEESDDEEESGTDQQQIGNGIRERSTEGPGGKKRKVDF